MFDMAKKALFVWHIHLKEYFSRIHCKMKEYEVCVFNYIIRPICPSSCLNVISVDAEKNYLLK